MADNIVEMEISEHGQICVAKLQEVIADFDLTARDAAMAAGELFAWVHVLGFMLVGKEKMLAQIDRSSAAARGWADAHFEEFKARAEVVAAMDSGESGGRLQ